MNECHQTFIEQPKCNDPLAFAVKEEPKKPEPVTFLQLPHGSGELDFEMDFGVVLPHDFEADVLRGFVSSVLVGAVVTHS